jgi:glutathione synthase/RimK-type ligase-like ATP-grasp enzyme
MMATSIGTSPFPSECAPSPQARPLDLVVLGNPGGRRVVLLDAALARYGMPPARVISYIDYLQGKVRLADVLREGSALRIESPGQDFDVERAILVEGIEAMTDGPGERLGRDELRRLAFERGRILCPKQWYAGFSHLLFRIEQDRTASPAHDVMNDERGIAVLFDKGRCHERLTAQAITCPRALGPVGSYDELRWCMSQAGVGRVFIKLTCGSSASGVIALESSDLKTQAFTTTEMVESRGRAHLYNSRRIQRLRDDRSIARLVDALAAEGVHVERWVPKAGLDGHAFDVRVVVIAGHANHAVVRMSRSAMTNLHLKNRRGSLDALRARMGRDAWESLIDTCKRASRAFPGCQYVGVDVAVLPGYRRHAVLEVNAFGDLLPGVLDPFDRDTYMAEIEELVRSPSRRGR